jgi:hypothetical protein
MMSLVVAGDEEAGGSDRLKLLLAQNGMDEEDGQQVARTFK